MALQTRGVSSDQKWEGWATLSQVEGSGRSGWARLVGDQAGPGWA